MSASHPDHRQWRPRSERVKGFTPSGSDSVALTSILSAEPGVGCFASIFLKQFLHYFSTA